MFVKFNKLHCLNYYSLRKENQNAFACALQCLYKYIILNCLSFKFKYYFFIDLMALYRSAYIILLHICHFFLALKRVY